MMTMISSQPLEWVLLTAVPPHLAQ